MEEKGREILKNTIVYAVGNLGSRILSFVMVPLYSFYLSKEQFGYYDIVVTTVSLLVPLVTLQVSDSVFRWLLGAKDNEEVKENVITNAYALLLFNILLASVLLLGVRLFVTTPVPHPFLLMLLLITSSAMPIVQLTIRGLQENKLYAISGILFSAVLVISNVLLLVFLKMSVQGLFLSTIVANVVTTGFLMYKRNLLKYFRTSRVSLNQIRELLRYSWPLIPNTISWWMISSANKYIILAYLGVEANGIYGMANRFPAIMVMIDSILIMAWQESAILNFHKEDRNIFFSKVFNRMVVTQLSAALLLGLSSRFIVQTLINNNFLEAWKYMPILFLGVAFSTFSGFYGTIYLSLKNTKGVFITTVVAGIINVITALVLIKYYGLFGVAFGTFLGFVSLYILRIIDTRKHVQIRLMPKPLIGFLVLFGCAFGVMYLNNSGPLTWTLLVVALIYTFFLNWDLLSHAVGLIREKLARS